MKRLILFTTAFSALLFWSFCPATINLHAPATPCVDTIPPSVQTQEQEALSLALKTIGQIDWDKINLQVNMAIAGINFEKIQTEVNAAFKAIDWETIKKSVDKVTAEELKLQMKESLNKAREEIEKSKKALKKMNQEEIKKMKEELEKSKNALEKARKALDKSKTANVALWRFSPHPKYHYEIPGFFMYV